MNTRYLWNYSTDHDPTNPMNLPGTPGKLHRTRAACVRAAKQFCLEERIEFADDMVAEIDVFGAYPMDLGLTTADLPRPTEMAAARANENRWRGNRILAEAGLPVRITIAEALALLREHTGIDYTYLRGVNGMVLSHVRPDGWSVETPCPSLALTVYRLTSCNVEIS